MATNFNPATKISVSGPLSISDKRSADMPLDIRGRIETLTDITTIPFAWEGMLVYVRDTKKYYKVTSLANRTVGGVAIPYYPATWVEFGSGGSTPSPTPSDIDAGDVSYFSSGTFSNNTVGKELQNLANDILSLAEDIHNLSGDIGTLSNLDTENKQDLVAAINEVLASTGSTITVVNNLISNSTTDALSAYQGKVLKGLIDGKVTGIKVQGESSVLPMDGNGIVTIPAGGGGTGTITGATVGGNPVTASGGILQFDAYPTANTMQYSSSTNYASGTIGKEVKDLNTSINDLSTQVAELDKPSPTPSSSTTIVNLAEYVTSSSSFTYDVDNKYIYNTKDTTFYQYSEEDNSNTVYYGVFKVIGEDRYLMYSITNNTTFTYVNTYTELTLPENAKKEFALGSVAVIKRVNGEGESWKNGTVNLFCTKQNMALRNRCKNINFNGSTAWRVFIKSEDGNTIFVYKAKSNGNYEWEINVPRSSTANFNLLDKYFDRPEAINVSFDDSVTHLNTDNVQGAINLVVAAVASSISVLVINLLDYTGAPISEQSVTVTEIYNGTTNTYSVSSTNGIATCSIHYGSIYTITYGNRTNRLTPSPATGIAENIHINIFGRYMLNADYENLTFSIRIKGANTNVYTPNDKHVYVDYRYGTSDNYTYTRKYTIVLNSKGAAKTIYNENNEEVNNCTVPKNQVYRISLENYTDMDKSTDKEYTAQAFDRTIEMYYYYRLSGIFLVVEDYTGSTDLDAYTEYKCLSFDDVENKVTIIDNNDDQWDIVVDSNTGDLMKSPVGQSNYSTWIEAANFNRILGIGLRTSNTIDHPIYDATAEAQGFIDSSMLITNTPRSKKAIQNRDESWQGHPNYFSGRGNTNYMASSDDPYSDAAVYAKSITFKTGNVTQTGFIPSSSQAVELYLNRENIVVLATMLNYNNVLASTYFTDIFTCSNNNNGQQWYIVNNGVGPKYPAARRTEANNIIILFSF